jgi:hypothetical protein
MYDEKEQKRKEKKKDVSYGLNLNIHTSDSEPVTIAYVDPLSGLSKQFCNVSSFIPIHIL